MFKAKPEKPKLLKNLQRARLNVIVHAQPTLKDRVRTIEVAAGRVATVGLLIGTTILDFKGIPFTQQFIHQAPNVIALSLIIAMATIIPNIQTGIPLSKVQREINSTRFAMVAMTLLLASDKFLF